MLCRGCLLDKTPTDFYAANKSKCKECVKAGVRENRLRNIEHYRNFEKSRASRPERKAAHKRYMQTEVGKQAHARATQKWAVLHAIRRKANNMVNNALRDGKLQREPCFICGEKAQAHHPNYDAPLSVTWLCPKHHKEAHAIAANDAIAKGEKKTHHF